MKGCLCIPTGPAMAKEVATPMMKRNCISTVSCLCRTYLCLWPLPSRHLLLVPSVRPLSSGSFSFSVLSQSSDTPHISGPPKLRGPVAGCAFVCQRARCQKRHPGEELGSRQALDPRSLDSSGSSAHWINPTHQATPTGESPASSFQKTGPQPMAQSPASALRVSLPRKLLAHLKCLWPCPLWSVP